MLEDECARERVAREDRIASSGCIEGGRERENSRDKGRERRRKRERERERQEKSSRQGRRGAGHVGISLTGDNRSGH